MTEPSNISKYQIIGALGAGHFGKVYHVRDRALRAEKAIKVLSVTDPNEFISSLKEAQILHRCRNKHIVQINEANIFNVEGSHRVVLDLEYIAEGSLENALLKRWVSVQEAVVALRGALTGLEYAHGQGFLHRDIKPGNILLSDAGAKLSDFGLATLAHPRSYGSGQGYTTHLAPECFATMQTSQQSDIFAAGITLYRTVSNIPDWLARVWALPDAASKVEQGKVIDALKFPDFVPKKLQRVIRKACAPDVSKRYQSAVEFRQQLDRLRFGIDWVRMSDYSWEGLSDRHEYSCSVDPIKKALVVCRNGRRVNKLCKKLNTVPEAIEAMNVHVSETTLQ